MIEPLPGVQAVQPKQEPHADDQQKRYAMRAGSIAIHFQGERPQHAL
jgi:hypothetical protein